MDTSAPNPAHSRQVIELLTVANEYCLFVEKASEYTVDELAAFFQKVSPLLYIKGALLPEVMPSNPEADERFVTEEQWSNVFADLKMKFGDNDVFWGFDPLNFAPDDARRLSLAEHLADIYQDMKDFVLLYQKNTITDQENAAAAIRNLFFRHWGPRLTVALNQLHYLIFRNSPADEFLY